MSATAHSSSAAIPGQASPCTLMSTLEDIIHNTTETESALLHLLKMASPPKEEPPVNKGKTDEQVFVIEQHSVSEPEGDIRARIPTMSSTVNHLPEGRHYTFQDLDDDDFLDSATKTQTMTPRELSRWRRALYSIYVGRIPYDISKRELSQLFSQVATVQDVHVQPRESSMSYTYGFVRFATLVEARDSVAALHGRVLANRHIVVELAQETRRFLANSENESDLPTDSHDKLLRRDYPTCQKSSPGDGDETILQEKLCLSTNKLKTSHQDSPGRGEFFLEKLEDILKKIKQVPVEPAGTSSGDGGPHCALTHDHIGCFGKSPQSKPDTQPESNREAKENGNNYGIQLTNGMPEAECSVKGTLLQVENTEIVRPKTGTEHHAMRESEGRFEDKARVNPGSQEYYQSGMPRYEMPEITSVFHGAVPRSKKSDASTEPYDHSVNLTQPNAFDAQFISYCGEHQVSGSPEQAEKQSRVNGDARRLVSQTPERFQEGMSNIHPGGSLNEHGIVSQISPTAQAVQMTGSHEITMQHNDPVPGTLPCGADVSSTSLESTSLETTDSNASDNDCESTDTSKYLAEHCKFCHAEQRFGDCSHVKIDKVPAASSSKPCEEWKASAAEERQEHFESKQPIVTTYECGDDSRDMGLSEFKLDLPLTDISPPVESHKPVSSTESEKGAYSMHDDNNIPCQDIRYRSDSSSPTSETAKNVQQLDEGSAKVLQIAGCGRGLPVSVTPVASQQRPGTLKSSADAGMVTRVEPPIGVGRTTPVQNRPSLFVGRGQELGVNFRDYVRPGMLNTKSQLHQQPGKTNPVQEPQGSQGTPKRADLILKSISGKGTVEAGASDCSRSSNAFSNGLQGMGYHMMSGNRVDAPWPRANAGTGLGYGLHGNANGMASTGAQFTGIPGINNQINQTQIEYINYQQRLAWTLNQLIAAQRLGFPFPGGMFPTVQPQLFTPPNHFLPRSFNENLNRTWPQRRARFPHRQGSPIYRGSHPRFPFASPQMTSDALSSSPEPLMGKQLDPPHSTTSPSPPSSAPLLESLQNEQHESPLGFCGEGVKAAFVKPEATSSPKRSNTLQSPVAGLTSPADVCGGIGLQDKITPTAEPSMIETAVGVKAQSSSEGVNTEINTGNIECNILITGLQNAVSGGHGVENCSKRREVIASMTKLALGEECGMESPKEDHITESLFCRNADENRSPSTNPMCAESVRIDERDTSNQRDRTVDSLTETHVVQQSGSNFANKEKRVSADIADRHTLNSASSPDRQSNGIEISANARSLLEFKAVLGKVLKENRRLQSALPGRRLDKRAAGMYPDKEMNKLEEMIHQQQVELQREVEIISTRNAEHDLLYEREKLVAAYEPALMRELEIELEIGILQNEIKLVRMENELLVLYHQLYNMQ